MLPFQVTCYTIFVGGGNFSAPWHSMAKYSECNWPHGKMIRAFKCLTKANTVASVQKHSKQLWRQWFLSAKWKQWSSFWRGESNNTSKQDMWRNFLVESWRLCQNFGSESYQEGHRLSHTQHAQAWMVLGAARPMNKRGVSWYRLISLCPPRLEILRDVLWGRSGP